MTDFHELDFREAMYKLSVDPKKRELVMGLRSRLTEQICFQEKVWMQKKKEKQKKQDVISC